MNEQLPGINPEERNTLNLVIFDIQLDYSIYSKAVSTVNTSETMKTENYNKILMFALQNYQCIL